MNTDTQGAAPAPGLLTVRETARLLAVSPKTIYKALYTGRLPVTRIGRIVRVHRGMLERRMAAGQVLVGGRG